MTNPKGSRKRHPNYPAMRCRPDATPAVLLTCWAAGSWLRRSRTDQPWTRARASTQSWPGRTAARREECRSPSPDQQHVMPARSARARARPTFSSARDAEPLRHTSEPGVERPQPRAGYERRRQQMRVDPPDPDAEQPAPPNEGKHFFVQCDRKLRQPVKVGWRQQISTPDSAPASGWRRIATAESASG